MANERCVYDLWLLLLVFLWLLMFKLLHVLAIPVLLRCFRFLWYKHSNEEREKLKQLKQMTAQKAQLNMTDNFAKYSKLERQIKKLDSELQINSSDRWTKSFAVRISLSISLKVLQVLSCMVIVLYVRHCYVNLYIHRMVLLLPDWMHYEFIGQPPLWAVLPFWMASCHYWLSSMFGYFLSE